MSDSVQGLRRSLSEAAWRGSMTCSAAASRRRLFLVEGVPARARPRWRCSSCSTGAARGETVLYVTLSETTEELRAVAASHGWSLDGITSASSRRPRPSSIPTSRTRCSIRRRSSWPRPPADSRGCRAAQAHLRRVRLALGAAAACRHRAPLPPADPRAQAVLRRPRCTVLLLDDMTATDHDLQLQSIAHGVVLLEQLNPEYGSERRRLRVVKYRGDAVPRRLPRLLDPDAAGSRSSRAWSRRNTGRSKRASQAAERAFRRSTPCSAAASRRAPAR